MPILKDRPRYTLALLVLIYMSNYLDRVVVGIFGQAIKLDLQISDTQLGVLTGVAFGVFYGVLGVPLGRLADRTNRKWLLAACVSLWSVMTILSAAASSFIMLMLMRIGVAVGEAGCTPTAHSMLSDLFPPRRRSMAFGVYAIGPPLGVIVGSIGGGWVAQELGWRVGMIAVGVPGVILALLLLLTTREPARGRYEDAPSGPDAAVEESVPPFLATLKMFMADRLFVAVLIGLAGAAIAVYSLSIFTVPFLVRTYALDLRTAAGLFGLAYGAAGVFGASIGAGITDWAGQRDARWYAGVPSIGFTVGGALLVGALFQPHHYGFIALFMIGAVLVNIAVAPSLAVVLNRVSARTRGSASAIILMVSSLVGLGLGPTMTGVLSDLFAANAFDGVYAAVCPGGYAPQGAAVEIGRACASASAIGLRGALALTIGFYVVAGVIYAVATRFTGAPAAKAT